MPPVTVTEPALLIRISKLYRENMGPEALYEATRGVWRVGEQRESVELVFAVAQGIVRGVFSVKQWHPAGTTQYKTRPLKDLHVQGRWEFTGSVAPRAIESKYLGKSVAHYFARGASNPVLYVNMQSNA